LLSANRRFRFAVTGSGSCSDSARRNYFILDCVFVPRIPWIVLFLVSGACLDQAWGISQLLGGKFRWTFKGRAASLGIACPTNIAVCFLSLSAGGFGSSRRRNLFDHADFGYGLRPIHLVREMVNLARRSVAKLAEWRVRRRIRKSDHTEQLKTQKQQAIARSATEAT